MKRATQEQKDAIVALYLEGKSARESARAFGYDRKVCLLELERRGIPVIQGRNQHEGSVTKILSKKSLASQGYVTIRTSNRAPNGGRIRAKGHRVVMEGMIGRPLTKKETVHHKNGIRSDNRPENLELWDTRHAPGQRVSDKIAFAIEYLESHGYKVVPPEKQSG